MARKNLLLGISEPQLTAVNLDNTPTARVERTPPLAFSGRGALGAVTRTIDDLSARADAAKGLEARLAAGEIVVELDPTNIDSSFVADRMLGDDESYVVLRESIREQGQTSPILVRPHPTVNGRYQVAFGHRRLRVAADLGRPVRAVVKQLSDRDLVIAQGQENSARADLSFIERARFARQLETMEYDRETIMSALSVDKTALSRMISVATRIPESAIAAIGPAPTTGRPRWLELADHFQGMNKTDAVDVLLKEPDFLASSSDRRFELMLEVFLRPTVAVQNSPRHSSTPEPKTKGQASYWSSQAGQKVAKVTESDRAFVLTIDRRVAPDFGEYLLNEMDRLYEAYSKIPSQ